MWVSRAPRGGPWGRHLTSRSRPRVSVKTLLHDDTEGSCPASSPVPSETLAPPYPDIGVPCLLRQPLLLGGQTDLSSFLFRCPLRAAGATVLSPCLLRSSQPSPARTSPRWSVSPSRPPWAPFPRQLRPLWREWAVVTPVLPLFPSFTFSGVDLVLGVFVFGLPPEGCHVDLWDGARGEVVSLPSGSVTVAAVSPDAQSSRPRRS